VAYATSSAGKDNQVKQVVAVWTFAVQIPYSLHVPTQRLAMYLSAEPQFEGLIQYQFRQL
jgi:hypothetical protein